MKQAALCFLMPSADVTELNSSFTAIEQCKFAHPLLIVTAQYYYHKTQSSCASSNTPLKTTRVSYMSVVHPTVCCQVFHFTQQPNCPSYQNFTEGKTESLGKILRADTTNKKAFYAFVNVIVGFPTPIPAEQGSITTFVYFFPILIFLKTIFPTLKTEGEIRSTM